MIMYLKGNILCSTANALVCPVNVAGAMGKGLAYDFKMSFPYAMYKSYKKACSEGKFTIGNIMIWRQDTNSKAAILFPTKSHWRNPSSLEIIEIGLRKFISVYNRYNFGTIAFPKLGCGYGGLDWNAVKPLMESYLESLPNIQIFIYE